MACLMAVTGCLEPDPPSAWNPGPYLPVNPTRLDPSASTENREVFPDGVMAGDPAPGRMLLWTRTVRTSDIRLKVWIPDIDAGEPERVDLIHDRPVGVGPGGAIHTVVTVVPGRRHGYLFHAEEDPALRSRVGYFTASPPHGAKVRLTLSGTHGTHQRWAPYENLVKNAEFEPYSLYLHLGDAVYADRARTLDEFREFWRENWQTEGFRAVLNEAVYLPVWDDHEVDNNYDPETIDAVELQSGLEAFFEANPVSRIPGAPHRLWRSWKWGDTVEFFALDVRSERKPSTRDDPFSDPPVASPDATYISPGQMDWLKSALASSTAVFKLVINSVPITAMPNPPWINICDTWSCYTRQRSELVGFLVNHHIENVYFITGDYHMAMVARLDPPGGEGEDLWEFILGPGAQSNPLGDRETFMELTSGQFDPLPPDQFLWGFPTSVLSYVDLDPLSDPPQMTVRYYRPDGSELYSVRFTGGEVVELP
jgi:alkaline phosphatase D